MSGDSSSLDPPVEAQSNPTQSSDETSLPADIRQQVEQEQALADAQKRLKALEEDNERIKKEKKDVEDARDGAGTYTGGKLHIKGRADGCVVTTTNQLRSQLSQLQTTHHTSSSELNVIQLRLDVSCCDLMGELQANGSVCREREEGIDRGDRKTTTESDKRDS